MTIRRGTGDRLGRNRATAARPGIDDKGLTPGFEPAARRVFEPAARAGFEPAARAPGRAAGTPGNPSYPETQGASPIDPETGAH